MAYKNSIENANAIISENTPKRGNFIFDAAKYPEAIPNDRGYEYSLKNKRTIFDSDAFTDWVNKNSPGSNPQEYMPDKYKFSVETGGKYIHFPTFDEAYNYAANEPIKNPFDLSDENIKEYIRPMRQGSMSQEVGSIYENLSDKYGLDFGNLIYGENGFENSVIYPNGKPKGYDPDWREVVYDQDKWQKLDDWFKQNTGMSLSDREKYVEQKRKELYGY